MIGKILADISGLTEKLNGKYEPIKEINAIVNKKEWEQFQHEIQMADGDTVKIKTAIDDSELQKLKSVEGLYDYAVSQAKAGKNVDIDSVNSLIQEQNYTDIANQAHGFSGVKRAIAEYNKSLKKNKDDTTAATNNTKKFIQTLSESNPKLANCMKNAEGSSVGFLRYAGSLATATLKTVALNVATTAMNAAISMGVSIAANFIISGIDYLIHYSEKQKEMFENAKKATEEYAESIRDLKSEMSDTSSKANELSSEFATLVQGVDPFTNKNKKLSTESYERFLDVSNQLAELFPSLTKNYDENGNAILGLSGDVDTVTASIAKLVEQQNNLAKADIRENLDDYVNGTDDNKGIFVALEGLKTNLQDAEDELTSLDEAYDNIINQKGVKTFDSGYQQKEYLKYIKNKFGQEAYDALNNVKTSQNDGQGSKSYSIDFSKLELDEATKSKITKSYSTFYNDLQTDISVKTSELENKNREMSDMMMVWVEDLDLYKDGDSSFQKAIETMVGAIHWSDLDVEDGNIKDAKSLIQSLVLTPLSIACDNPDTKLAVTNALNSLFTIDFSKLSFEEANEKIKGFLTVIMNALNEGLTDDQKKTLPDLYEMFGLNDYDETVDKMQNRLANIAGGGTDSFYFFSSEEYDKLKEYTKDFTQEEAEAWLSATNDAKDAAEAVEMYTNYKKAANETPDFSSTDALSQVESLSKGLDQLDKIYTDIYDKDDFDWSSILNNDNFKEVFGDFKDEYNDFIETVSNSPDDIDACQTAFDRLATAFINDSDAMKNLSEETKDVTIKMLEQMGVANAQEVVTAKLAAEKAFLAKKDEISAITSKDLADATWEEIYALIKEGEVAKETKEYLAYLALERMDFENNPINTTEDVDAILDIARASKDCVKYIAKLEEARDAYNKAKNVPSSSGGDSVRNYWLNEIENISNEMQEELENKYKYGYGGSSTKSAKENTEKAAKDTSQTYDWIETALSRIEQLISRLKSKADSAYKSWSSRNNNLKAEISAVRNEIDLQQQAYERYMQMADSVGLSDEWASKVQNGQINIETITDENLADRIKEYQDWYEKALDCRDAMEKLDETVKDLYKTAFDNISSQYDDILSAIEHQKSMLDESISQAEQSNYKSFDENHSNLVKSIGFYKELLAQEQSNVSQLIQERDALTRAFQEAMGSGMEQNSETWAQMRDKINDVTLAIEKSNTTVLGYHDSISKLFETAFDNIESMYDNVLSAIENRKNLLDASISQTEEKGWLVSAEYYKALMKTEKENLTQLEKERTALLSALSDAVSSGAVKEYTQAWYDMKDRIDDVTIAIEEANTAVIKYGNSIRDIEWSIFDLLNDRISSITSEADFLIDLMSNDKLYDEDTGKLTDEGMATMGLHGVDYNIYMAQADQYAEEILKINRQLAEDPYNQELLDRRQELLEQQQEMILAAESEKQAIKDMVEEGIKLELDALKELIDTYTDALDSQKDLYDYQKKVSKQTKEIASLQKQLSAYENDLPEEARAKVQQIRVSLETAKEDLEEMEYEKYIADQKKLLDDLYLEYELILNQRLDDLDALISEMIGQINTSAVDISTTLSDKAESVGYTLSDSMTKIWDTSTGNITDVLTTYGKDFLFAESTVNETLKGINTNLQNMITQLNTIADMKIQSVAANATVDTQPSGGGGNSGGGASNQAGSASPQPPSTYLYRKTSPIIMK